MCNQTFFRVATRFLTFFFVCFLSLPNFVFAQKVQKPNIGFRGGLGLNTTEFKDAPSDSQGIGKRGWGIYLDARLTMYQVLTFGLDGGVQWVSDKKQFSQLTTGGYKESSISVLFASASAGLFLPPISLDSKPNGTSFSIGLNVGLDWVDGSREISECIDCRKEDIELRAGRYIEPELILNVSENMGLAASFRKYNQNADLEDMLIIKFVFFGNKL